jgi:hypothetical protein
VHFFSLVVLFGEAKKCEFPKISQKLSKSVQKMPKITKIHKTGQKKGQKWPKNGQKGPKNDQKMTKNISFSEFSKNGQK